MATKQATKTKNSITTKTTKQAIKPSGEVVSLETEKLLAELMSNANQSKELVAGNKEATKTIQSLKRDRTAGYIVLRLLQPDVGIHNFNTSIRAIEDTANNGKVADPTFTKLSRLINNTDYTSQLVKDLKGKISDKLIVDFWDNKKLTSYNKVWNFVFKDKQLEELLDCLSVPSLEIYNKASNDFVATNEFSEPSEDEQKVIDNFNLSLARLLYQSDTRLETKGYKVLNAEHLKT